jgi:hypothetical protein
MTRIHKLLSRAARRALLPALVLCLSHASGARVAAQTTPGTSSRSNLYGQVCLTTIDKKGKLGSCTYLKDILVVAVGAAKRSARTNEGGEFRIWVDETGRYSLTAKLKGYSPYGSPSVWVPDIRAQTNASPPPIFLTGVAQASKRQTPRIVLVLYRVDEGARPPAGARRQADADGEMVLHGCVRDDGNNAVGGALVSVLVTSKESGRLFSLAETKTDKKKGCYDLPVKGFSGYEDYVFSVTRPGFNRFVALLGADETPPQTVTLQGETISDEPLLSTDEATRRHVFTSRVMETLPVPGLRSFDTFALLAPGVAPPPETPNTRGPGVSPGLGTAGQFSVNGLRSRENNFTVDGSDNNDEDIGTRRQGFVALAPQSIESLNEFQIVTALGDARFGRRVGGQVNALTKSGSSEFHGSLYGFITDDRLNARDFFDGKTSGGPSSFALTRQRDGASVLLDGRPIVTPNPVGGENSLTRTQLGFAVGGPVPKVNASFFVSLERVKMRAGRESHFVVPTVEQRGFLGSGATGLILDGRTDKDGNPAPLPLFPTNVPGDAVFSLYPFPNNPLGPFGRNTYTEILPADADGTRVSAKIDRRFGTPDATRPRRPWSFFRRGDTLTGRYNFSQETSAVPITGEALFSSLRPRVRTQNIAFYLNRPMTDKVGDVIRFSFGRTKLTFREERDPSLLPSTFFPDVPFLLNAPLLINVTAPRPDGTLTQPSYLSASGAAGASLLTSLGYSGVTSAEQIAGPLGQVVIPGFSPVGVDVYHFPQTRSNNTIQAADTITYVSPAGHIFTFGAEMRKTQINSTLDRNFRPLAVFSGLRASTLPTNLPVRLPGEPSLAHLAFDGASLTAAGLPTGLFQTLAADPNSTVGIRFTQGSFFGQTDWRVRDNLVLNLGARFNYLSLPHTKTKALEKALDRGELERQADIAVEDCFRISGDRPECERVANSLVSAFPTGFESSFGGDRLDLDARVGAAWSLDEKTVVRGGFGLYSGEFPGVVIGESRNAFPAFLPLNFADVSTIPLNSLTHQVFLFNPANPILRQAQPSLGIAPNTLNTLLPNVNAVSLLVTRLARRNPFEVAFSRNTLGLDLVLPQEDLHTPYSMQYAVTLERTLAARYAISVAYVGTRGLKLLRVSTPDLGVNRGSLLDLKVTSLDGDSFPFFGGGVLPPQESIPKARLVIARTIFESSASSTYNSLQVELRKHYAHQFQFRTALTYSHAIDDASDFFDTAGSFALPQDTLQRSERASSNFDVRLRSVTHFVRDFTKDFLFFGPTKFGGWQLAGIATAQTGQPFTVNSAFDINRDGNLTDRLNTTDGLISGVVDGDRSVRLRLAPGVNASDLLARDGQSGAVGRNTFRAPSQFEIDLALTKFFNFNDRVRLSARAEIFNLLNRANFGIPVRILESPAFGKSTYTTTPPRTTQFAVKLSF